MEHNYLEPNFDPKKLKVAELRRVLLAHQLSAPSSAKKQQLVDLFLSEITPRASQLRTELTKVKPSNVGIVSVGQSQSRARSVSRPRKPAAEPKVKDEDSDAKESAPAAAPPATPRQRSRSRARNALGSDADEGDADAEATPAAGRGRSVARSARARRTPATRQESFLSSDDEVPVPKSARTARSRSRARPTASEDSVETVAEEQPAAQPARSAKRRVGRGRKSTATLAESVVQPLVDPASPEHDIEVAQEAARAKNRVIADATARALSGKKGVGTPQTGANRRATLTQLMSEDDEAPPSTAKSRRMAPRYSGNFSDDNPFQSAGEGSPDDKVIRRRGDRASAAERAARRNTDLVQRAIAVEPADAAARAKKEPNVSAPLYDPFAEAAAAGSVNGVAKSGVRQRAVHRDTNGMADERVPSLVSSSTVATELVDYGSDEDKVSRRTKSSAAASEAPARAQRVRRAETIDADTIWRPIMRVPWCTLVLVILGFLTAGNLVWYRHQKLQAGYCATGTLPPTPAEGCTISMNDAYAQRIVIAGFIGTLQAPGCTPCPAHAMCENGALIDCTSGFVLRKHPLTEIWPFPAICVPDTERETRIHNIAQKALELLAEHDGQVSCGNMEGELGLSLDDMKAIAWEHRELLTTEDQFNDAWAAVVQEISNYANDLAVDTKDGVVHLVSLRPTYPLSCQIRRGLWHIFTTYYKELLVGTYFYGRFRFQQSKREAQLATEMVERALDILCEQEHQHYVDPTQHPHAAVAISHLRDVLLRDEHDLRRRQRVWERVRRVVERNSNVRARVMELRGEQTRAWEWVGTVMPSAKGGKALYPSLRG
ncbi:Man1-Src1p-C-terminal domain-containing protein [Thamnocephalis sphaerospora]|uniref:Man1-Src1p-C-terminal domain-containing protein n=1 Tax=Thamnocephalis sphaerospora TaxID=78915 RepID=A0A4P9XU90_9FUNG|nr:Man1-Src1p-C-terminal domain-containing protein [Thamnocephalis sphaerospora]|eukprot:RKP09773.1 Man1-Src1p-C-terminal domain-containing protein [Thamnocephalis sphaerospora]